MGADLDRMKARGFSRVTQSLAADEPTAMQPSARFLREGELRRGAEFVFLAARSLAAVEEDFLARHGFGPAHGRALFLIRQHEGLSVGDLVVLLNITKQSLSRVLDNLAQAGLVDRRQNAPDGRVRCLYLTDKGRHVEQQLFQASGERILRAYEAVGQQAVGHLWQTLLYLMDDDIRARLMRQG